MVRLLLLPAAIVAAFCVAAGILIVTAPVLTPAARTPVPLSVRTMTAAPQQVKLIVHSQGTVMPSTESQLIPEVPGRIEWVSPNLVPGGYFDAGDVLARIENDDYENARNRSQAARVRAEAELVLAEKEYARQTNLIERNLASRSAVENALRALEVARAALRDSNASFEQASTNLSRTELKAPFDGIVRSETVDIGQYVGSGQAIATLYASDAVEVRLPIADRQLAFLKLPPTARGELAADMQPQVTLTASYAGQEQTWQGHIVRMEAEIDVSSRMVQLVARVRNRQDKPSLSVGLFVEADIQGLAVDDIVVVPRTALREDNQMLVIDEDSRLRFRTIEPLRLYQDDVFVRSGLKAGERICISPIQTPIDGMTVEPIQDLG